MVWGGIWRQHGCDITHWAGIERDPEKCPLFSLRSPCTGLSVSRVARAYPRRLNNRLLALSKWGRYIYVLVKVKSISRGREMHKIFLPAFDLSSPSKADGFECSDNIAVVFKGPQHTPGRHSPPLINRQPDWSSLQSRSGGTGNALTPEFKTKKRTRPISAPAKRDMGKIYQNSPFLSK